VRDGRPVAGVEVTLVSNGRRPASFAGPYLATTDSAGRFTCPIVTADRDYVASASASGLAAAGGDAPEPMSRYPVRMRFAKPRSDISATAADRAV
jgi:hypothetical protein